MLTAPSRYLLREYHVCQTKRANSTMDRAWRTRYEKSILLAQRAKIGGNMVKIRFTIHCVILVRVVPEFLLRATVVVLAHPLFFRWGGVECLIGPSITTLKDIGPFLNNLRLREHSLENEASPGAEP